LIVLRIARRTLLQVAVTSARDDEGQADHQSHHCTSPEHNTTPKRFKDIHTTERLLDDPSGSFAHHHASLAAPRFAWFREEFASARDNAPSRTSARGSH
jgi:hypothetical protein